MDKEILPRMEALFTHNVQGESRKVLRISHTLLLAGVKRHRHYVALCDAYGTSITSLRRASQKGVKEISKGDTLKILQRQSSEGQYYGERARFALWR